MDAIQWAFLFFMFFGTILLPYALVLEQQRQIISFNTVVALPIAIAACCWVMSFVL